MQGEWDLNLSCKTALSTVVKGKEQELSEMQAKLKFLLCVYENNGKTTKIA